MRIVEMSPLKSGNIWWNVAPLGEAPEWREVPKPSDWDRRAEDIISDGERLFGYARAEFLAKQYK